MSIIELIVFASVLLTIVCSLIAIYDRIKKVNIKKDSNFTGSFIRKFHRKNRTILLPEEPDTQETPERSRSFKLPEEPKDQS